MLGTLLLILFGLILIIVEVLLLPGAIVGIIGFIMMMVGVWQGYSNYGILTGSVMLASVLAVSGIVLWLSIKYEVWSWGSLKTKIDSRFNDELLKEVETGQTGKTISALRPSGKASINGKEIEVQTQGLYVEPGTEIKIISVEQYKIIVEPIS